MGLGSRAVVALQYLLPQHALTALVHRLTRSEMPWLRRLLIRGFCWLYAIDLADAAQRDPDAYRSFNEFFTRGLAPGARRLPAAARAIASPCDGTVSERGTISGDRLLQARLRAKSRWYTLSELLGGDVQARDFAGGEFATIYLAPYNYHRVHMPLDGRLTALHYLPGRLFSVSGATAAAIQNLYARNERVVCRFATAAGPVAVVFVGALNVGSIAIVGFGDLTPALPRVARAVAVPTPAPAFTRGEELGRFNMGSTIIVLLPRGAGRWAPDFVPGASVRMGTAIGELTG
ncbi:MAG TPA: archaetidylserine decarboxylase [Steroidobacteraceae bacterium]|nr:archaetidylserine decarboxylase [Steroidobacteraceae bacterium]